VGGRFLSLRTFTATAYFDARYRARTVAVGGQNVSVAGNRVESVPRWIAQSGLTATAARWTATAMVSHVASSFADPQEHRRTHARRGARDCAGLHRDGDQRV